MLMSLLVAVGLCLLVFGLGDPDRAQTVTLPDTGGPDAFGYVWDDSIPVDWIDLRHATPIYLDPYEQAGPIALPFDFPFYGSTYTQVWVSSLGSIGFSYDPALAWSWSTSFPSSEPPNNVIAPNWSPSFVPGPPVSALVHYKVGDVVPTHHWFAVGWAGSTASSPFEVILYEGGDIVFQYGGTVTGGHGIENADGSIGLGYPGSGSPAGAAVRFYIPGPATSTPTATPTSSPTVESTLTPTPTPTPEEASPTPSPTPSPVPTETTTPTETPTSTMTSTPLSPPETPTPTPTSTPVGGNSLVWLPVVAR